jgi:hypothetical protein
LKGRHGQRQQYAKDVAAANGGDPVVFSLRLKNAPAKFTDEGEPLATSPLVITPEHGRPVLAIRSNGIAEAGPIVDAAPSTELSHPIHVSNFVGALREHADKLRMEYGSGSLPDAVDGFASGIAKTAAARGDTTIGPRELRSIISDQQGKAFSGSFANPADAKEAWQEVTRVMRGHLEGHVEKYAGKEALAELKKNNKDISILLPFKSSAEDEIAASRLLPDVMPDTRTGRASVSAVREMAKSTKDEDVKRALTGELYGQVGTENAHKLAALDDKAALMSRLEAPLTHIAERGTTAPTTLRSHGQGVRDYLERGGIVGGLALAATGHFKKGAAVVAATLATKYGVAPLRASERGIAAMVTASRAGATAANLRTLGNIAKVPREMAEDAIGILAPREHASRNPDEAKQ